MIKRHCKTDVALTLFGLILSLLINQAAFAQSGTSSVRGVVTDPQGNVVAGATVTLTNPVKNFTRTQTTGGNGNYTFAEVPPDTYSLEVSAGGFKKGVLTEVRAFIAKPTDANVQLEVGNVAETVTVSSGASESLINNQDATLGNNFESRQITQLPLEARDVNALLTLQPGVTKEGYVNGARSDQSNVTLDGVDINEAQTNQIGNPKGGAGSDALDGFSNSPDRGTVLRLQAEAIEEFRVTTSNPNAAQGRSSGAQISLITRGGSNDFRGALFEFNRNTTFSANDVFRKRSGLPREKLNRNTFGGALGGPIIKDRAYFFYSYEGRRDASDTTILQRVPLPSLGRGEIVYLCTPGPLAPACVNGLTTVTAANLNTIFAASGGVNQGVLAALAAAAAKYPANDFTTVGDGLNTAGYRFSAPLPVTLNGHVGRFDLNLTSKQQLSARVNIQHDLIGGLRAFPDTPPQDTWSHPWGFVIGHLWTINNSLINNFRYGLTREAFTFQGDSAKNEIYFRRIFFPVNDSRTISRKTPVQNIVNDLSWIKGNHTAQFGANIRIIRNQRATFANAFDTAYTNSSGYAGNGSSLSNAISGFSRIGSNAAAVRDAAAALLGRLTTIDANFTFDRQGNLLPQGTASQREFATEEYDFYGQDIWKISPSLTITYGLRYGLSRPVYETSGYEAKPNIPLSEYFQRRLAGAAAGTPYNEPISVDLSGPANGKSPLYHWDKNNFQPRIGVAWSPNFKSGFLGNIFGKNRESVIRGGFGITNDYYGQQLAVSFDLNNSLGFSSTRSIVPGTCNTTTVLCPAFTSFSQQVRDLLPQSPFNIALPSNLTFPQTAPSDNVRRIESSLDENLVAPISYSWNVTFERSLPAGLVVQASYTGRAARNLLVARDVMALNDLVDPRSGVDWYTAAGMLEDFRHQGVPITSIAPIPYFENLFGSVPGFIGGYGSATRAVYARAINNGNDWTETQNNIDRFLTDAGLSPLFYQPQYGALSARSSVGRSNYHAGSISIRQRLGQKLTLDFNYTLSHSMDDASGLQTGGSYGTAFILNPIRQSDNYANSDFDVRHVINFNGMWQLPVGRGQWLLGNANKVVNAFLGGWQLSGIYRWNSGLPLYSPYDDGRWATNWNVESSGVRTRPVQTCPDGGSLFGCNRDYAYQSWRNARPGETGDRNVIRLPGYISVDMGLSKSFKMPWGENHQLQVRAEGFNVTNIQNFGSVSNLTIELDPQNAAHAPTDWWNFSAIQGKPRVIQFGFRYSF